MSARILIVDDIAANARLLDARLSAEYYQVATAGSGREGLEMTRGWRPDLVLLDVMMPDFSGYEICRRLKDDPETRHIPIVMVTALDGSAERVRGLEAGADDFLTRPVHDETLLARVRSLVRLKRLLDELRVRGDTARVLGLSQSDVALPEVAGSRALVVEATAAGGAVVQDALAREGIAVHIAMGEAEALSASEGVDLIVLSMTLADADGLRLAARLRATDALHDVPLLLIGREAERDRMLRGFEVGANDWLLRPVDENELRARARNLIRRKLYQDRMRADLGQALEMALIDPLTGLYNKRYLNRHLSSLIAAGPGNGIAVMMVDVDHFKRLNDSWGHAAGDRALRAVADTLRGNTRVFDSIARYGGEEFVVVMPGVVEQDALAAAERLREEVAALAFMPQPGTRHALTVSIGVAWTGVSETAADLLDAADEAMYAAKRTGRNRVASRAAV
jgi:two-component system cell cycle response regulator